MEQMEQTQEQIAEQRAAAIRSKEAFQELLSHQAWDQLVEVAEAQIKQRENIILGPAPDADSMLKIEYMKGELQGIRLFLQLPGIIIEQSDVTVKQNEGEV